MDECPIVSVNDNDRSAGKDRLLRLKSGGNVWYGMHELYRNYYLYADIITSAMTERDTRTGLWGMWHLLAEVDGDLPQGENSFRTIGSGIMPIPIDKVGICRYNSYLRDRRKGRERL